MVRPTIRQIRIEDEEQAYLLEDEEAREDIDGISEEIIAARTNTDDRTYPTVGERLDAELDATRNELVDIRLGYDGTVYDGAGEAVRTQIEQVSGEIDFLGAATSNIADIIAKAGDELSGVDHVGSYITTNGKLTTNHQDYYMVTTYEASAGDVFVLHGKESMNISGLPMASFSTETFAEGVQSNVLIVGTNTFVEYNKVIIAPADGYVHIAWVNESGKGRVKLYSLVSIAEHINDIESEVNLAAKQANDVVESLDMSFIADSTVSETMYSGRYIGTGNTPQINEIANQDFKIYKYPVLANKNYKLLGTMVKLAADAYPFAAFSTEDLDSVRYPRCSEVIIEGGSSATSQNFDVDYSPSVDGFVYTAIYSTSSSGTINHINVATANLVPKLVYDLSNSNNDTVKIQTFGDSITDDYWRSDHTTWATLLPGYIPQRNVVLKNSAVGGSGIGHGHSDTARYADLEYNYVYDLVTNEDIFDQTSDIFIMFVGTNNWAGNHALGEWGDNTTSTFYGAARLICEHITANTGALFFVCTPCGRYNSADQGRDTNLDDEPINGQGKTLRDYCDALVRTCHFYGVPVIDLNYDLGWNRNNVARFCSDGLHPTPDGAERIAQLIAGEIKKHFGI